MVPKPIGDNAQKQRLTIALKNICRDYPAGGGVLRELLQNADDARATTVRFYLDDEGAHPTSELIHPALAKYQGPALLAYNNAAFTLKDFESLSRLGDSLKLQDGLTTGKFGRGFNSVYNWTDSPSIVSDKRLLILDPHEEWSLGGNVYDFVKDSQDIEIQNAMAAFQSVMDNPIQPLDGTIIRIPLRTPEQAMRSEISNRHTTVMEIREVLDKFAAEFGNSGLLFMKNVQKVSIESTTDMLTVIEIVGGEDVRKHKSKVNNAFKTALADLNSTFDHSFELKIKRSSVQESNETSFVVHHTIRGESMDNEIRQWAKDQKCVPWVAVAAQIPYPESFQGSLFTVLPLPIPINQPVFIHGLFSLAPDRASFYSQDKSSAKWNEWLLQGPVPIAWTKLLIRMAQLRPEQSIFEWFPRSTNNPSDHLRNILDNVLKIIAKDSLPLWWTEIGHVSAEEGLLNVGAKSVILREAFREAKVPIVFAPDRLHRDVVHIFNGQILDPRRLSIFLLNKNDQIRNWSLATKTAVLEYLLSESGFTEIGSLELIPFKDGKYRSIDDYPSFLCRSDCEIDLFNLQDEHNIDIDKLSIPTSSVLQNWCLSSAGHKSIRYRSEGDFREYFLKFVFVRTPPEHDMVSLESEASAFISKAWVWIVEQNINILGVISDLWLVPLSNGHHRKVKPRNSTSEIISAPSGPVGDFMRAFDAKYSSRLKPLLKTTGLSCQAQESLISASRSQPSLHIKQGNDMVDFSQWLYHIRSLVNSASEDEKLTLLKILASNFRTSPSPSGCDTIRAGIGALQIFKKVSWKVEGDKASPMLVWTSTKASDLSVILPDGLIAVPELEGVQFLNAPISSFSLQLLNDLQLATYLRTPEIVEKYIISKWGMIESSYSCKEQIARLVFSQYSGLSPNSQIKLRDLPLIPVARFDGIVTSKFSIAKDLIDRSSRSKELIFDDEEVVPESSFYSQYHMCLQDIGLKTTVDELLATSRIHKYADSNYLLSEIEKRVKALLRIPCPWRSSPISSHDLQLRHLKWLPVTDSQGALQLKSPAQCRPLRNRLLVGSQFSMFNFPISIEWEALLGWGDVLPKHVLLGQLQHGLQNQDRAIIDAVLTYIVQKNQTSLFLKDLQGLPCVLTSKHLYVTGSKAFRPPAKLELGCEGLHPYLGDIDKKFWQDHQILLEVMGIRDKPSLGDLLAVQTVLEAQLPLGEQDIAVAVEILRLASRFHGTSLLGLKALSIDGNFYPLHDVSYNDLGVINPKDEVKLTHADITLRYVVKLGIELLSERLKKGMLQISDIDDEDEFEQHEKTTTRIADTLDRYSIDSTFREYLANADDTVGTSRISWLLDERNHTQEKLVTSELKAFQGPALLVYNDGVFSDDDFKGFKNVGEGSKRDNKETIGQFGRGSQTMYHWTDVPMILSGTSLIILDPLQEVLPMNLRRRKRKPGVKIELSVLREVCPGQLSPFEGLWDYTRNLDSYPGTIFRFPLRNPTAKSTLRVSKSELNTGMIHQLFDTYFDEARISLLFLKHIRSIDFTVYGSSNPEWSIKRHESLDDDSKCFSGWMVCSITKNMDRGLQVTAKDKWWVAVVDLQPTTNRLPYSPRRVMKNVECGIAGLVSSTPGTVYPNITSPQVTKPRIICTLPLPLPSDIPVYIHASFSLSGDRQSLIIDEHGLESPESQWNRYLLNSAIPDLYLSFLEDIGRQIREKVLDFWPQRDPPVRSSSELICRSFWGKVPQSSRRIFPKDCLSSNARPRQSPDLIDIRQAIFDFLPKAQSDDLAPLLLSLGVNLVRHIPKIIADRLKLMPGTNSVNGTMLRSLFKRDDSRKVLQEHILDNPNLIDQLLRLVIPLGDDYSDLDECNILPLADGTVGPLRFSSSTDKTHAYYLASKDELKLFNFASGLLVCESTGRRLQNLVSSAKFNLQKLQLCHVGHLLKTGDFIAKSLTPTDSDRDKWLAEFWTYWNNTAEVTNSSENIDIDDFPGVFRVTCGTGSYYASPYLLNRLAAVVEPSNAKHQRLCDKIPQLWRFDHEMMPKTLKNDEKSFTYNASFFRFINALNSLASKAKTTLGVFVQKNLDIEDVKILRKLIIYHIAEQKEISKAVSPFDSLKYDLRSLQLWPSAQSSVEVFISAENSLIAVERGLLVPWMKQYSRFIDPKVANDTYSQKCLQFLGIQKVSVASLVENYILPLPAMSTDINWSSYLKFVDALASLSSLSSLRNKLSQTTVAVDGNRSLRRADELFDHEDAVFKSAFRGQEHAKFLHPEVQTFLSFWMNLGLRYRESGLWQPLDYLQCLQALSQRQLSWGSVSDNTLAADTGMVLSPLTTLNSSTRNFNTYWPAISREHVFPSQSNFNLEPEHRRPLMTTIATSHPLSALANLVSHKHVAVCWSQTPFAIHEPTTEVFAAIQGGNPPLEMVWKHLEHLADTSQYLRREQMAGFLQDLHSTYTYLQSHTDQCKSSFSSRRNKELWLNIVSSPGEEAILMEVKSSWTEIRDLNSSILQDAGSVKAIQPSLMPYEKLLRSLGCESIIWPTVTLQDSHDGHSTMAGVRSLRTEKKLLFDITFHSEERDIQAHRLILAAISEKLRAQWNGDWPIESRMVFDKNTDEDGFITYHALSTIINYAYEDKIDWSEMEASPNDDEGTRNDKLNLLLDLHKGADFWLITDLKSEVEGKMNAAFKLCVNIQNVTEVRKDAEYVNAKSFEKMCAEFIEKNRAVVERASGRTAK